MDEKIDTTRGHGASIKLELLAWELGLGLSKSNKKSSRQVTSGSKTQSYFTSCFPNGAIIMSIHYFMNAKVPH